MHCISTYPNFWSTQYKKKLFFDVALFYWTFPVLKSKTKATAKGRWDNYFCHTLALGEKTEVMIRGGSLYAPHSSIHMAAMLWENNWSISLVLTHPLGAWTVLPSGVVLGKMEKKSVNLPPVLYLSSFKCVAVHILDCLDFELSRFRVHLF